MSRPRLAPDTTGHSHAPADCGPSAAHSGRELDSSTVVPRRVHAEPALRDTGHGYPQLSIGEHVREDCNRHWRERLSNRIAYRSPLSTIHVAKPSKDEFSRPCRGGRECSPVRWRTED